MEARLTIVLLLVIIARISAQTVTPDPSPQEYVFGTSFTRASVSNGVFSTSGNQIFAVSFITPAVPPGYAAGTKWTVTGLGFFPYHAGADYSGKFRMSLWNDAPGRPADSPLYSSDQITSLPFQLCNNSLSQRTIITSSTTTLPRFGFTTQSTNLDLVASTQYWVSIEISGATTPATFNFWGSTTTASGSLCMLRGVDFSSGVTNYQWSTSAQPCLTGATLGSQYVVPVTIWGKPKASDTPVAGVTDLTLPPKGEPLLGVFALAPGQTWTGGWMFTQVTLNRTATYTTDAAAYSVNGVSIFLYEPDPVAYSFSRPLIVQLYESTVPDAFSSTSRPTGRVIWKGTISGTWPSTMGVIVPNVPQGRIYREYRFNFNDTIRIPEISISRPVTALWLGIFIPDYIPIAFGTELQNDNAWGLVTPCTNINFAWNPPYDGKDYLTQLNSSAWFSLHLQSASNRATTQVVATSTSSTFTGTSSTLSTSGSTTNAITSTTESTSVSTTSTILSTSQSTSLSVEMSTYAAAGLGTSATSVAATTGSTYSTVSTFSTTASAITSSTSVTLTSALATSGFTIGPKPSTGPTGDTRPPGTVLIGMSTPSAEYFPMPAGYTVAVSLVVPKGAGPVPYDYRLFGFGLIARHPTFVPYNGTFQLALFANSTDTPEKPAGAPIGLKSTNVLHFAGTESSFDAATRHEFVLAQPIAISDGRWWVAFSSSVDMTIYGTSGSRAFYTGPYAQIPADGSQLGLDVDQWQLALYIITNTTVKPGYTTPPPATPRPPKPPGWPIWAIVIIVILIILIAIVIIGLLVYIILNCCGCCDKNDDDKFVLELNPVHSKGGK